MKKSQELLSRNVKKIRESRKMTQSELAEKAELSVKMVQKIEYGKTSPSPETLDKLCKGLKCSTDELFFDLEKPRRPIEEIIHTDEFVSALDLVSKLAAAPRDYHILIHALLKNDAVYLKQLSPLFRARLDRLLKVS